MLWPIQELLPAHTSPADYQGPATYWYSASGRTLSSTTSLEQVAQLPRTLLVEAIAQGLMQQLARDFPPPTEGKMYGVLLVQTPEGEQGVLKAFSGLCQGQRQLPGWVPPIPGRELVALSEALTLAQLNSIKQELLKLQQLPERWEYVQLCQQAETERQALNASLRERQQQRQDQRIQLAAAPGDPDLETALADLEQQSRRDSREKREFKQAWQIRLTPLATTVTAADAQISQLKQKRRELSRQLQTQMHTVYQLTNFAGQSLTLDRLGTALPTGTGDCCAPKLLHYAASQNLKPLALAEFWWGPPTRRDDKLAGQFYGACEERCQPLLGFLLRGLSNPHPAKSGATPNFIPPELVNPHWSPTIIYEDEWLIVVDKPAGLLSVPGRCSQVQDSLWSRLVGYRQRQQIPQQTPQQTPLLTGGALSLHLPEKPNLPETDLFVVHRLDRNTSGVMLFAKDLASQRHLQQEFRQRQVEKIYEAIVVGSVPVPAGEINLPLWGDPENRPYQHVDYQRGRPSLTRFKVLSVEMLPGGINCGVTTRVEFYPVTGRTHQLRVHAAHPLGLGTPILGDRLYGSEQQPDVDAAEPPRLHLHARQLQLLHPQTGQPLSFQVPTPF